MNDPYATPKVSGVGSASKKAHRRIFKHAGLFMILVLVVNLERFFGSTGDAVGVPEFSISASVITLLLFYAVAYTVFSRVRSRR